MYNHILLQNASHKIIHSIQKLQIKNFAVIKKQYKNMYV